MGLKPEAWAMATVTHPAVAEIHGIESWRGRPFLVMEFLPRGTLADRLQRGPGVGAERGLDRHAPGRRARGAARGGVVPPLRGARDNSWSRGLRVPRGSPGCPGGH